MFALVLVTVAAAPAEKPAQYPKPAQYQVDAELSAPTPVLPTVDTYAAVYARVLAGERVTWTGTPPGLPFGTYRCELRNGSPWMEEVKPAGVSFFRPGVSTVGTTASDATAANTSSPAPVRSPAVIRTLAPTAGFSGGTSTGSGCPPAG